MGHGTGAPLDIRVDPRVELLSIVFHLARAPGFGQTFETPYQRAVDEHFGRFVDHRAVLESRRLLAERHISYNAPIDLAVYLGAEKDLDERWRGVAIDDYLDAVSAFAAETSFDAFFADQGTYYEAVEQRLAEAVDGQGIEAWFAERFGPRETLDFVVVPGLLTGPYSFGASAHDPEGAEHVYQVIGLENVDERGLPAPTSTTGDLIVHEMAHAYINPFVDRHREALVAAAGALFGRVAAAMRRQAYNSADLMVAESLVRAVVILFIRDRRDRVASEVAVQIQQRRGFVRIDELVDLLAELADAGPLDLDGALERLVDIFAG
jgi:hypothetical protein